MNPDYRGPASPNWKPGDPLWNNPCQNHQSGLYSFRPADNFESWADATSWPDPGLASGSRKLSAGVDELGNFIEKWHAWHRSLEPPCTPATHCGTCIPQDQRTVTSTLEDRPRGAIETGAA